MKATINLTEELFRYLFNNSQYLNNFTHEGLGLLYQHLDQQLTDVEIDLCELCSKYNEETLEHFITSRELTYQDVVEDDDGEVDNDRIVDFQWEDMSYAQAEECIRDYLGDSIIDLTEETVLFIVN